MPKAQPTNGRYRHGCHIATEHAANLHNSYARLDALKENPLWPQEIDEKDASDFAPPLRPRRKP